MNRLKICRQVNGLNQRQLAELSHTPQSIVSELERSARRPWLKVAQRLAAALNTSVQALFPDDFQEDSANE